MQKLTTCLWFDTQGDAAARFYTPIFKNSKINQISYYGEGGRGPKGSVITVTFELNGQDFMALNGGPEYKFSPAISLVVNCDDQEEVDHYWEKLSAGGEKGPCGWLTDQFGVSWQIVPTILGTLLSDDDAKKAANVMQVMLQMKKLVIADLQAAYDRG